MMISSTRLHDLSMPTTGLPNCWSTKKWISAACGGVGTPVTLPFPTSLHRIIKIDKHYMFETMEQEIYELQGFTRKYITSYADFVSTHYLS